MEVAGNCRLAYPSGGWVWEWGTLRGQNFGTRDRQTAAAGVWILDEPTCETVVSGSLLAVSGQ
jgi:hypothetical protein